jgi:hypothetical protein
MTKLSNYNVYNWNYEWNIILIIIVFESVHKWLWFGIFLNLWLLNVSEKWYNFKKCMITKNFFNEYLNYVCL